MNKNILGVNGCAKDCHEAAVKGGWWHNAEGRKIAQGKSEFKRTEGYKRYWLAMYTYNSVEGEYFDSNPSGYLGGH